MVSASESSLSEAETNKLIDQNMRLQKLHSAAEKELESVKQQNLEIIHQRDFYQDQVIFSKIRRISARSGDFKQDQVCLCCDRLSSFCVLCRISKMDIACSSCSLKRSGWLGVGRLASFM